MKTVRFAPFALFVGLLLSACAPPPDGSPTATSAGAFNPSVQRSAFESPYRLIVSA
jgi:hypothetical protein